MLKGCMWFYDFFLMISLCLERVELGFYFGRSFDGVFFGCIWWLVVMGENLVRFKGIGKGRNKGGLGMVRRGLGLGW